MLLEMQIFNAFFKFGILCKQCLKLLLTIPLFFDCFFLMFLLFFKALFCNRVPNWFSKVSLHV